jgi:hypothetical protein
MSRLTTGISGAVALMLISGAAQFAMGHDLSPAARPFPRAKPSILSSSPAAGVPAINRGAKADRATGPAGSPALTRTVSLKLNGFSDTSFLVRVSVAAATPAAASSPARSVARKPMVACEPVVSILTEVAKRLQPGRCVT